MKENLRRKRWLRVSLVVVAAALSVAAGAQEGDYDWEAARQLYPGIKHAQVTVATPRPMIFNCLQIDLRTPGLSFYATPRAPEWEASVSETIRQTTRQFMWEARQAGKPMVVAINADWWSPWIGATWNIPTPANVGGLAVSAGELVSPPSGTPSFIVHRDGRAEIKLTDDQTDLATIETAVSGFAIVLEQGVPTTAGADLHPRTCTGVSADGQMVYLLTVDGRQRTSGGASYPELGAWLKHFGAFAGANMDGGGSTTMAWWDLDHEGDDKSVLLNSPVGGGKVGSERCNGNNLGVIYQPPGDLPKAD